MHRSRRRKQPLSAERGVTAVLESLFSRDRTRHLITYAYAGGGRARGSSGVPGGAACALGRRCLNGPSQASQASHPLTPGLIVTGRRGRRWGVARHAADQVLARPLIMEWRGAFRIPCVGGRSALLWNAGSRCGSACGRGVGGRTQEAGGQTNVGRGRERWWSVGTVPAAYVERRVSVERREMDNARSGDRACSRWVVGRSVKKRVGHVRDRTGPLSQTQRMLSERDNQLHHMPLRERWPVRARAAGQSTTGNR